MVSTFVINLASRKDRWEKFKNKGYIRWDATSWAEIKDNDPMVEKMISFHNIKHTKLRENSLLEITYEIITTYCKIKTG